MKKRTWARVALSAVIFSQAPFMNGAGASDWSARPDAEEARAGVTAISPTIVRYVCRVWSDWGQKNELCAVSGTACVVPIGARPICRPSDMHVVCKRRFDLIDETAQVVLEGSKLLIRGEEGGHTSELEISDFPSRPLVAEAKLKNASLVREYEGKCELSYSTTD